MQLKPPRLLDLAAESRPEENEMKSEAQFQRMLASYSGSPIVLRQNKSSRSATNRGRYPEEADTDDDIPREDTPSDDDGAPEEDSTISNFVFKQLSGGSEPINIAKPMTPANSVLGTPEDYSMDIDTVYLLSMRLDILKIQLPLTACFIEWISFRLFKCCCVNILETDASSHK